nr:hypothetical protein [Romboutsia ilealis]
MNINKIRLSTFSFNERAIKSYKKFDLLMSPTI